MDCGRDGRQRLHINQQRVVGINEIDPSDNAP